MDDQRCGSLKASEDAWRTAAEYGLDVGRLEFLLTLSPAERLRLHEIARPLIIAARQAGIQYYGFDPRPPETAE